ncbi:hypothetical protein KO317_00700 [Candidatus Micrarchaeota archaeon]|nr:hypothetical protein [Candidatus Micrarchaeota archaeon]
MIRGGKINSVEAKRDKQDAIQGLSINIALDDVKADGKNITISYTYNAKYEEGVGILKIQGEIFMEEEIKTAKEIVKTWGEKKTLPENFAELVLNSINYTCGTNGTLVVRTVNLSPPMIPPRISLAKGAGTAKA